MVGEMKRKLICCLKEMTIVLKMGTVDAVQGTCISFSWRLHTTMLQFGRLYISLGSKNAEKLMICFISDIYLMVYAIDMYNFINCT